MIYPKNTPNEGIGNRVLAVILILTDATKGHPDLFIAKK